jgi:hypothetical protein
LATGFTAVSAPLGGTGQTSYAVGDILFASTSTALSKLAGVAVGNALISGGVADSHSYGKIVLATHVSGTLPIANGGTGNATGNAATATILETARTINGVSFNGSANITVADATKLPLTGGTLTGDLVAPNLLPPTDNTGVVGNASFTWSNGNFTNLTVDSTLSVRAAIDLADSDVLRFGSSDDWELFHNGTDNYMDLNVGNLLIRDTTTTRFTFARTTGDFTATGNVTAFSDERVKTNWRDLQPNFVEQLANVKHGVYDRTDQQSTQVGVSAQSLREVMEHAVMEDESGMLSVAYGNAALVACVELAKEVLKLRAEIEALKKQ